MGSTVAQNFEQVSYAASGMSQQRGAARQIIGDAVATRQLAAKESGALCLFDRAAGVVYTLPTPVIGMQFEFQTTVTITSNAAKVITKTVASEFILGLVDVMIAAAATTLAAAFNGTTHVAISMNGTTTGGVIGDRFRLTAISTTQWVIDGVVSGSGTIATPAATS
jgi:hypothetical protein